MRFLGPRWDKLIASKIRSKPTKMALSREAYVGALSQLGNNITVLGQQLETVENALQAALMQKSVSTLFVDLNDSADKQVIIPGSKFAYAINSSPGFYKLEANGDFSMAIGRNVNRVDSTWSNGLDSHWYKADSRSFFMPGELAEMAKGATFDSEGKTTVTAPSYRATPAFYFPGCEPKPVEAVIDVTTTAIPAGAQFVQVAQPTPPTVLHPGRCHVPGSAAVRAFQVQQQFAPSGSAAVRASGSAAGFHGSDPAAGVLLHRSISTPRPSWLRLHHDVAVTIPVQHTPVAQTAGFPYPPGTVPACPDGCSRPARPADDRIGRERVDTSSISH